MMTLTDKQKAHAHYTACREQFNNLADQRDQAYKLYKALEQSAMLAQDNKAVAYKLYAAISEAYIEQQTTNQPAA